MTDRIRDLDYPTWVGWRESAYPLLFGGEEFREGRFLFRGGRDASWQLVSSFDRFAANLDRADRTAAARRLLKLFLDECEDLDVDTPEEEESQIALAQHHGVPTRALDWTESPFIAAYFAFADLDLTHREQGGDVAIWALDVEDPAFDKEAGAEILRGPRRGNDRLLRQRGAFTYLRAPYHALEDHVKAVGTDRTAIWKFRIPRAQARAAAADLLAMGITGTRLFPDLGGAARSAVLRQVLEGQAR